ncbi:hypothetical protein DYI37_11705 [Fulvimarina endophytica]|uniref:Uncharacterized protein n=1 Tax=Fulvimarina endophytica TaxID=2293836 RepID=A0A371X353_9HYPH|nr:hypothetical protein DYI37_11705 [Fulvimarina endophytica]
MRSRRRLSPRRRPRLRPSVPRPCGLPPCGGRPDRPRKSRRPVAAATGRSGGNLDHRTASGWLQPARSTVSPYSAALVDNQCQKLSA